jgi:hypothetical protein
MTAQRRPPWDVDPRYVDPDEMFEQMERVDPRDVETREEFAIAGRLVATVLGIVLVFFIAWFISSKLAEGAARPATSAVLRSPVYPGGVAASTAPAALVPGAPTRWQGTATWYCGHGSACTAGYGPNDLVAAIDRSLGIAKGELVIVRFGGHSVTVRIVDVCACGGARLIDLTTGAFQRLAKLEYGVLPVTLEVVGPLPTLPATDAD